MQQIRRAAGDAFADEVAHQVSLGLRIIESGPTWVTLVRTPPRHARNRGRWWPCIPRPRAVIEVMIIMDIAEDTERLPRAVGYGAAISAPGERVTGGC